MRRPLRLPTHFHFKQWESQRFQYFTAVSGQLPRCRLIHLSNLNSNSPSRQRFFLTYRIKFSNVLFSIFYILPFLFCDATSILLAIDYCQCGCRLSPRKNELHDRRCVSEPQPSHPDAPPIVTNQAETPRSRPQVLTPPPPWTCIMGDIFDSRAGADNGASRKNFAGQPRSSMLP